MDIHDFYYSDDYCTKAVRTPSLACQRPRTTHRWGEEPITRRAALNNNDCLHASARGGPGRNELPRTNRGHPSIGGVENREPTSIFPFQSSEGIIDEPRRTYDRTQACHGRVDPPPISAFFVTTLCGLIYLTPPLRRGRPVPVQTARGPITPAPRVDGGHSHVGVCRRFHR